MNALAVFLLILVSLNSYAQSISIKLNKNAVLILERAPFNATGKKLKFYDSKQPNESKSLIAINGLPVFGTDGEVPKYVLKKAVLVLNSQSYLLRVDTMYNPWFGKDYTAGLADDWARLIKTRTGYQLQAVFSDGAGSYRAEWTVTSGIAKRTRLSADDQYVTDYYLNRGK